MESRIVLGPRIAEGGMAEVFAARMLGSEGFAKDIVVKRVLPQLAREPEFIARFLDEARLAAQLSHPGIVQVLQLVSEGDVLMMAMEAVDGADLSTILKSLRAGQRTLSVPLALRVASSVAGALAYAHEKRDRSNQPLGIIHRDVTPSNVLVSRDGATKLIDFGIARASSVARLTRRGSVVGKINYMAPEQVSDRDVDARADLWSLGVVLFQMLTGTRPFFGDDDTQIFRRIVSGERPDVRSLAQIPEALARIVDSCLATDRDRRIATARALALALDDVIAKESLYASAAELGDLVRALVPPTPPEITGARADGRSHTVSTLDAGPAASVGTIDEATGPPHEVVELLDDTTPARKQRGSPTLTLDSAETTFLFDAAALTRLATNERNALTSSRPLARDPDELATRTLDRTPAFAPFVTGASAAPAAFVKPRGALPRAAGAVVVVAVAAIGAWGAFADGDHAEEGTAPVAALAPVQALAPIAPIAPIASIASIASSRPAVEPAAPARAPVAALAADAADAAGAPVERKSAERVRPKRAAVERADTEPGHLVIDSRPWSTVTIDGVRVGVTPIARRELSPGTHTVVLENDEQGLTKTVRVVVKSGRTTTSRVDLRR